MKLRLKNFLILILCLLYFPFRGKANRALAQYRKILVAQMAKLGDMVCTTPTFTAIKKRYSNAKVIVLGNTINKALLHHHPYVDGYIAYKDDFWQTVNSIRKEKIDAAVTLGPGLTSLALLYLGGVKSIWAPIVRNGWSPYETRAYKILRNFVNIYEYPMSSYVPKIYLDSLRGLDIKENGTKKKLLYSASARNDVLELFARQGITFGKDKIIGIAPSVGNKVRLWPVENFAELISHMNDRYGCKIVIFGSAGDKEQIDSLMKLLADKKNIVNTMGMFDLDELKAAISLLDMYISVETGLTFIAESFNIPLVNITGPVDEKENSPRGADFVNITAKRNNAEVHVLNSRVYDLKEARRQIVDISVKDVIVAVEKLLKTRA